MSRARNLADYVSTGVTAAEFDFLDTTSGTPGSGTFLRGDKTWVAAGGSNTPAFHIKGSAPSSTGSNVWTLIDFKTTEYDTGSFWVAATNKFLPTDGVTKKYFIYTSVRIQHDDDTIWEVSIYKNGSAITYSKNQIVETVYTYPTSFSATMIELDGVDDYIQVFARTPAVRAIKDDPLGTYLGGYALIN